MCKVQKLHLKMNFLDLEVGTKGKLMLHNANEAEVTVEGVFGVLWRQMRYARYMVKRFFHDSDGQ